MTERVRASAGRRVLAMTAAAAVMSVLGPAESVASGILLADAKGTLVALDGATGRETARTKTKFGVDGLVVSPDGTTLVLFDRRQKLVATLAADTLATLGVVPADACGTTGRSLVFSPSDFLIACESGLLRIDRRTGRLVRRLDMGYGELVALPDGAAALVITKSQTAGEAWLVGGPGGDEPAKIPLAARPARPRVSADSRYLLVDELSAAPEQRTRETSRIDFIDLATRRASAVVELPPGVTQFRQAKDGAFVYALNAAQGVLHVVAMLEQRIARTIDLGGRADFVSDIDVPLIRTAGPDGAAQVRLLQGLDVRGPIPLAAPLRFRVSPDGDRVVVLGATDLYELQLATLTLLGHVRLPRTLVAREAWPEVNWSERRVAIHDTNGGSLIVTDLAAGRVVREASTGRESTGRAVARVAGNAAESMIGGGVSDPAARALIAVTPGARSAVTLNPRAATLTAVNMQDGTVTATAAMESIRRLCFCLGTDTLVVFRRNGLSIVDPVTLVERARYDFARHGGLEGVPQVLFLP